MTGNSSSLTDSHLNDSFWICLMNKPGSIIYTSFTFINVFFFLPLFIFILHYGLRQWKNGSISSASTMNHSDCFTYHLVVMELVGVIGCIIIFGGIYWMKTKTVKAGYDLYSFTWNGQGFFHILTCVEHYLAVVHPITYLTLKEKKKLRIRNTIIGFVWLLSFVGLGLAVVENYIIFDSCVLTLTITITPFCSLSVLWVLNRSGPGESNQSDQSKQRVVYTVVSIQLVLLLRFAWNVVWMVNDVQQTSNCVVMTCEFFFNLPSSLVLPLLFLQRAGKLRCSEALPRVMVSFTSHDSTKMNKYTNTKEKNNDTKQCLLV